MTSGKTKNAKRRLKIPEQLRPLIQTLVQTRQPDDLLFFPSKGNPHPNYYWLQVRRLCRLAGVTVVCAHSLRGLHATLALDGGATADAVARALGHGSFSMTERHYASASSVADSKTNRVAATLAGESTTLIELVSLLKEWPVERQLALLAQVRAAVSYTHLDVYKRQKKTNSSMSKDVTERPSTRNLNKRHGSRLISAVKSADHFTCSDLETAST